MDKTKDKKENGKINKEEVMIKKHCTLTEWPKSLIVPSGVANCHNLPFDRRARLNKMVRLLMKKMCGVATNVYSMKTLEKPKRRRSVNFENEGLRVVYARGRY